jgi:hypothetical protein
MWFDTTSARTAADREGAQLLAASRLHVVYRAYGGENTKGRPPYYSKLLALASLVRAVEEAREPVEVVFVNDGPVPKDWLALMESVGEVVQLSGVGLRRCYLTALSLPSRRRWDGGDLVWFSEDDYLYLPSAFAGLLQAAARCPEYEYFTFYSLIGRRPPYPGLLPDVILVPSQWRDSQPVLANGHPWRRALSSTATFGARVAALRQDRYVVPLCLASASVWDHTTNLVLQGYRPFSARAVVEFLMPGVGGMRRRGKLAVAAPIRMALNLAAARQRRIGRQLLAPDPPLATHLEARYLAVGWNWTQIAEDTMAWAATRGIHIDVGQAERSREGAPTNRSSQAERLE